MFGSDIRRSDIRRSGSGHTLFVACRARAYTPYSAFTKGMSDEKRKPKNEKRNRRTPRPIRSDPTDRDPRSRDRARGRWVCVRILILLRVVTQLVLVRMRRVESIDRKGSGRLESIDRKGSGRSIDRSKRVLESIDRSIDRKGSGRVEVGPGGTAPGTTRATRRRRRRTAARNSRTELAHAREEKFLATELGDFSRLLASTRSHARGLALVDSLGWYRARLRGTRDVGDDDVRDDDAARGGGAGGVEKTDGNNV